MSDLCGISLVAAVNPAAFMCYRSGATKPKTSTPWDEDSLSIGFICTSGLVCPRTLPAAIMRDGVMAPRRGGSVNRNPAEGPPERSRCNSDFATHQPTTAGSAVWFHHVARANKLAHQPLLDVVEWLTGRDTQHTLRTALGGG